MITDVRQLQVTRVIAHEVPRRRAGETVSQVGYSEIDSELNDELRNYFRERILSSVTSAGYDVIFRERPRSPVPDWISEHLRGITDDFVETSKQIADHLYQSQTAVNSPGLLCLVEVTVQRSIGLAVLKLDKVSAIRVEPARRRGIETFNLEHLRDLILSQKNKVFKASVFFPLPGGADPDDVEGVVSDNQRGFAPTTEVADFFLREFLGCELVESPDVATRRYFQYAEDFFSERAIDPEKKTLYEAALISDLNNQRTVVRPRDFAETHLDLEDRQDFIEWLSDNRVETRQFEKDTALIKNRLRKISYEFESGINVLIPPETLDEQANVTDLDDGRTHLQIRDRVIKMKGK